MSAAVPAIAGAAQVIQRQADWTDPRDARGPIELIVDAVHAAADDAGCRRLLRDVGWIGVAGGLWTFRNPGQVIAARIGAPRGRTWLSAISGSAPQELVGIAAEAIAAGEVEVALVVGGEARAASLKLRELGIEPKWLTEPGEGTPDAVAGITDDAITETLHLGAAAPAYALMEDSLRRSLGRSMDTHRDHIARLWEGFSAIAATNPYAADRDAHSAAEIRQPSPANRMISFPYPKAMVANNRVDMASAVVLCSVTAARAAGVEPERLVYPQVSTSSHDTWLLADRAVLHEAPALAVAGRTALDYAGLRAEEIGHLDLYACFPSIVEMSAAALGIRLDRPLTVTGGLGFAGAPIANSAGQAIAAMVPRLREGGYGFVHANGGSATKHAFGVYAVDPPPAGRPFRRIDCQPDVDVVARPTASPSRNGDSEVEAATVMFDRAGPTHVIAATLTPAGERTLVKIAAPDLVEQAMVDGLAGVHGPLPGAAPIG